MCCPRILLLRVVPVDSPFGERYQFTLNKLYDTGAYMHIYVNTVTEKNPYKKQSLFERRSSVEGKK